MENEPGDTRLDALFAAARKADLYNADKEYGFETRVIARIRTRREVRKSFPLWAWRLIPVLVSLVVLLVIWSYATESLSPVDLSSITRIGNEEVILTAFLTGE